jgi:hypothetical protein
MEDLKPSNYQPNFGSLTEIMERFQSVPYEQFQSELQNWFEQNLSEQKGLKNREDLHEAPNFLKLLALISKIYFQAEVNQTLAEANIQSNSDEPRND